MADFTTEFSDAGRFASTMSQVPITLRDELRQSTDRLTLSGESMAKGRVHVVSGHLRRSIANTPARFGGGVVSGSFGTAVPYAGSENARGGGHAFLSRTVRELRPMVPKEYAAALDRAIAKVRGS
ncbi:MAG: hypothetical protein M3440_14115 [Chloroflexota bacterium]|nr:hypothetical protein [Chloroflexota bacterium]